MCLGWLRAARHAGRSPLDAESKVSGNRELVAFLEVARAKVTLLVSTIVFCKEDLFVNTQNCEFLKYQAGY